MPKDGNSLNLAVRVKEFKLIEDKAEARKQARPDGE
jgi:hypothetical protein